MPEYILESQRDVISMNGRKVLGFQAKAPYRHLYLFRIDLALSAEEILADWKRSVHGDDGASVRLSPNGTEAYWICRHSSARGPNGERSTLRKR